MSQYVDLGQRTLWNPSHGAAALFLRQTAVFEAELGLSSGIGPMEADECQIDPIVFETFANALLTRHHGTQHGVILALSEGFIATTLVLAERAGIALCWTATAPDGERLQDLQLSHRTSAPPHSAAVSAMARLRARVRELDRCMAR